MTRNQPFRALGRLLSGSVLAQLVTIASYPILTRLYGPADFALFGGFTAIVSIASVLLTFRADRTLIFTDNERQTETLLSTYAVMLSTGLFGFILFGLAFAAFSETYTAAVVLCAVVGAAITSIANVMLGWRTRAFDTRGVVMTQLIRAVATIALQLLFAVVLSSGEGLVVGAIGGLLLSTGYLFVRDHYTDGKGSKALSTVRISNFSWSEAKGFVWAAGQGGISAFSNNLPLLWATAAFAPAAAGAYVLADRLVRLPINLISNNLRNQVAAYTRSERGPNMGFAIRLAGLMTAVGLCGLVGLAIAGEYLFRTFFGAEWSLAAGIATILFVVAVANLACLPFQAYLMSERAYVSLFAVELLALALKVLAIGVVTAFGGGIDLFATGVASVSVIYYTILVAIFFKRHWRPEL